VGSGTINDLTKLSSSLVNRPYMSLATAASMDGYTAYGASITYKGSKQTFMCPAPTGVVADLNIVTRAPVHMNAAGYADLLAKVTAGADWIVADFFGIEPIDQRSWEMVQTPLLEYLESPSGIAQGDPKVVENLLEGLMMGGFAMQWLRSSRPASGAEHQFSHLWDMEHHTNDGETVSHGFKVGIGTLASTALYEQLFGLPLDRIDVDAAVAAWPEWSELEKEIASVYDVEEIREKATEESKAKYADKDAVREQLTKLKSGWGDLRTRLHAHLLPLEDTRERLAAAGAPYQPGMIGITRERMKGSYVKALHLRRRFTVLDFAHRAGVFDKAVDAIFDKESTWPRK
jgi:glycerol-1-phosphate dehydrogenase [NAD(P)+]